MFKALKRIMLHFDDKLGILSMLGTGIAGAALMAVLAEPFDPLNPPFITLLIGITLIVLDYFYQPLENDE